MGDGERIDVRSADLVAHAGRLDGIADALSTAERAGTTVRLDAAAYGQLCAFVPALLDGLQNLVVDGIDAAAGSVRDTAGRVRTAASAYDGVDGRVEARFHRIRQAR